MRCSKFQYLAIMTLSFLIGAVALGCGDGGNGSSDEDNYCGDGIVAGAEQCDDGNTIDGDCCSSDCQFEPVGTVCDDGWCYNGAGNGECDGTGNCMVVEQTTDTGNCTVFLTSMVYDGALDGLAGADCKCQELADKQGLTGTFKAWLSDSATSASDRLTHSVVPYVDVWGRTIANDWEDLTDGTLDNAILVDEKGYDYTDSPGCDPMILATGIAGEVWTDTRTDGSAATGRNCMDWTDNRTSDEGGEGGFVGYYCFDTEAWTDPTYAEVFSGCAAEKSLYCFQQ